MDIKKIERKIKELTEQLRREVSDYIEFLLKKSRDKRIKAKGFKFDREGGLSEIRKRFTSVELPHRTLEWRDNIFIRTNYFNTVF